MLRCVKAVQLQEGFGVRSTHGFALLGVFTAAVAALLPGCGGTDAPSGAGGASSTAGASGSSAGGNSLLVGNATKGAMLWASLSCNSCHGVHAEGGNAPNITKSTVGGIGAYTQAQFYTAVREAKNKAGQPLCFAMAALERKTASDQDIADLYAFQQAQPAVDVPAANPIYCTNSCCTGEHK